MQARGAATGVAGLGVEGLQLEENRKRLAGLICSSLETYCLQLQFATCQLGLDLDRGG